MQEKREKMEDRKANAPKGKSLEEALQWAPINSMSVVQKVGAQEGLVNEEALHQYLEKAPDWYKPQRF